VVLALKIGLIDRFRFFKFLGVWCMQRREFSVSSAAALGAFSSFSLTGTALAQASAFKDGVDYLRLDQAAPVDAPAGKIEVVEFFWYSCPHCNRFEPMLEEWAARQPADVVLRRAPIAFKPDFEPQQRLYFVLESMGKVAELGKKVFAAIHVEKVALNTAEQIANWIDGQGIKKADFMKAYDSFPVATKTRKATLLQESYRVDGVPALGVGGLYYTSGSAAKTMERALQVVDSLVAKIRSEMPAVAAKPEAKKPEAKKAEAKKAEAKPAPKKAEAAK
jgi:protein dithiol oxidoreductase (disulfide-forming)